jgi:hypothetical protein
MFCIIMLNVFMLSVTMQNVFRLSVIMLNVFMLSVAMRNVIMLSVIMLNVFMLSVLAPFEGSNKGARLIIQATFQSLFRHGRANAVNFLHS